MPVIPALRRLNNRRLKFKTRLDNEHHFKKTYNNSDSKIVIKTLWKVQRGVKPEINVSRTKRERFTL